MTHQADFLPTTAPSGPRDAADKAADAMHAFHLAGGRLLLDARGEVAFDAPDGAKVAAILPELLRHKAEVRRILDLVDDFDFLAMLREPLGPSGTLTYAYGSDLVRWRPFIII
ncbi:MAG: hypothetical protein ACFCVE_15435 [Phycisphaerae bacterium]